MTTGGLIDVQGLTPGTPLHGRILRQLGGLLGRVRAEGAASSVLFADDNGPKGGRAIRCTITLKEPRRPPLVVEKLAETHRLAFDAAYDTIKQELGRRHEARRERARRPKKYFVARRLRESGLEGPEPGEPPLEAPAPGEEEPGPEGRGEPGPGEAAAGGAGR